MEITQERIDAAYAVATPEQKKVLDALFGTQTSISIKPSKENDNRPVTERIKTFDDAVSELGDDHPLVNTFFATAAANPDIDKDVDAYLKLRVVVAALNEGWTPQFIVGEYRWAPWFELYTNSEIDQMEEEEKASVCRVVGRANYNASALGGLTYASAHYASSYSNANYGSRLAFKSGELAKYAGRQFIELYRDMMIVL